MISRLIKSLLLLSIVSGSYIAFGAEAQNMPKIEIGQELFQLAADKSSLALKDLAFTWAKEVFDVDFVELARDPDFSNVVKTQRMRVLPGSKLFVGFDDEDESSVQMSVRLYRNKSALVYSDVGGMTRTVFEISIDLLARETDGGIESPIEPVSLLSLYGNIYNLDVHNTQLAEPRSFNASACWFNGLGVEKQKDRFSSLYSGHLPFAADLSLSARQYYLVLSPSTVEPIPQEFSWLNGII